MMRAMIMKKMIKQKPQHRLSPPSRPQIDVPTRKSLIIDFKPSLKPSVSLRLVSILNSTQYQHVKIDMMQQQSFGYIISAFLLSYSFYLAINLAKQPKILYIFFYQGFLSQTLTIHTIAGEGRGPSFYSSLSLQSAHEHSDIYSQLCL